MGSASLHFGNFGVTWANVRERLVASRRHDCVHLQSIWQRLSGKTSSAVLAGSRYCLEHCFEPALRTVVATAPSVSKRRTPSHRIPLGLLLLSRRHVTVEQLRAALEAQQSSGRGKVGEWLLALGYVSQQQLTAALARQWSCPVLRADSLRPLPQALPRLPFALMESARMVPVGYSRSSGTLHLAFSESVDYNVLYAIEQMTQCRTAPCLALPDFVQQEIALLPDQGASEAAFECGTEISELTRIVQSYCTRISAQGVRVANAGSYTWIRLLRGRHQPFDLLFRSVHP